MSDNPDILKKIETFCLDTLLSIKQQINNQMATTIMMSPQIESSIREMCKEAQAQVITVLAEKYGFDAEEANRFLDTSPIQFNRKRGPSPKTVEEKAKGKPKKAVDPNKPKRAKTGYLLYSAEVRAEVRSELESELEEGTKLKPQDVVKAIAARWKEEDEDVRKEWNDKAKALASSDEDTE